MAACSASSWLRSSPLMTMALPARRAAVGMVAVAVPAVRTRPPAAVNATLTGSMMGAGAPETERRLEKKQKKMGLQNQILQTIVDSNKNNNKINTKMKFINIEMLKSEKDDVKINEEDVITIQVTNNNNNNNISQKIDD